MKRSSLFLSLSVLAHLLVIDLSYYLLTTEIPVNFLAIATYNIVWLILALMVGTQVRNGKRI